VVLANNAIVNKDYEQMGGSKSFGEFGSMLREIFEPGTEARFEWDHWAPLRHQAGHWRSPTMCRNPARSTAWWWRMPSSASSRRTGAWWKWTPRRMWVMRVSTIAENIPPDFPIRKADDVLDYDYQEISGHTFLLPLKSQVYMTGGEVLTKARRGVPPVPQVLGGCRHQVRHRSHTAAAGRQDQRDPCNAAEAQQEVARLSSSFRTCCGCCKR